MFCLACLDLWVWFPHRKYWLWYHMPIITTIGRWRQEDHIFKVIFCYIRSWSQPGPHETLERERGARSEGGERERKRVGIQQLD